MCINDLWQGDYAKQNQLIMEIPLTSLFCTVFFWSGLVQLPCITGSANYQLHWVDGVILRWYSNENFIVHNTDSLISLHPFDMQTKTFYLLSYSFTDLNNDRSSVSKKFTKNCEKTPHKNMHNTNCMCEILGFSNLWTQIPQSLPQWTSITNVEWDAF